ncbi:MAG: TonB-dependent receptor [Acidobacteriota bacterium]|nr:TonB-dependent receptor [Acidobacteriota bacterium]
MRKEAHSSVTVLVAVIASLLSPPARAQNHGTIRGTVTFSTDNQPVHGAMILLVGTSLVELTSETGEFEMSNIPPGTYEVVAQREHLTAARQNVSIEGDDSVTVDFSLILSPVHEDLTVTATASGQAAAFEAFNSVTTLDSFELLSNPQSTLGEVLQNEPGVANRSFGPGSSRPIIRGFDGDRVLIMEDGIRTGDLSGQSGDHGILTDPNGLDRVEIVRGPATLLYGSNAIGGVINAITPHENFRQNANDGTRGQLSLDAGSANRQAGSNASLQHRQGKLQLWGSGGARRTGDYHTPEGAIENSATQLSNARAGVGYVGDQFFASGAFTVEDGHYGVPFAGNFHGHHSQEDDGEDENALFVDLDSQRRVGRFDFGMNNLRSRVIDSFQVTVNIVDFENNEIEIDDGLESLHTTLANRSYIGRAEFTQQTTSRLDGKFGIWAQLREFTAAGEEALAPPTDQTSLAAFAYEELDFGRYRIQFGGRLERNDYTVGERLLHHHGEEERDEREPPTARNRDFSGESVSFGVQVDLGTDTAFVTNVTHSHRAPSLEELYNFGPHVGTLMFEIGNPDLDSETSLGLDVSLRHQTPRTQANFNAYVYDIENFVFGSVTDESTDGLMVAHFLQADSRFAGFDTEASLRLVGPAWVNVGLGLVDAELTTSREPLPRIPPLRGRLSLDLPYKGLTISPEVILAAAQEQVYRTETVTKGYSVFNLRASYVRARQHMAHIVSVTAYNLTNRLYRNHTSFIKDLTPEIGRGIRFGYSLRFF